MNFECPIYSEIYSEEYQPKMIRCGHTMCNKCIAVIINGFIMKCPLCRNKSKIKDINKLKSVYQLIIKHNKPDISDIQNSTLNSNLLDKVN